MKNLLLATCLLGSLAAAQVSILNIPALPPGKTAPATPSSTVTAPATTTPAAPTVTTLPTGQQPLDATYTVSLNGPDTVSAGEATTWDFTLTNTGAAPIHLEHGACDVRFEVLNAAGEVVRPDPKNSLCTMQLVVTDAQNGESAVMQKIRWEGKDGQGHPVPAGQYTIRAKFVGAGVFTVPTTKNVTVQ